MNQSNETPLPGFESPAMKEILKLVRKVAPYDIPILITGETGTGKEVIANLIHKSSPRSSRPMIKVTCPAVPSTLAESLYFGSTKGAYTDSKTDKTGYFKQANNSTLFLDELIEMDLQIQSKLLGVLQDSKFRKVGSSCEEESDFRLICATNQSVAEAMKTQKFREDLYYRINEIEITVPPLRKRIEDIVPLAQHFLNQSLQDYPGLGEEINGFSEEGLEKLRSFDWPGNVRQLRSTIKRALILNDDNSPNLGENTWQCNGEKPLTFNDYSLFEKRPHSNGKCRKLEEVISTPSGPSIELSPAPQIQHTAQNPVSSNGKSHIQENSSIEQSEGFLAVEINQVYDAFKIWKKNAKKLKNDLLEHGAHLVNIQGLDFLSKPYYPIAVIPSLIIPDLFKLYGQNSDLFSKKARTSPLNNILNTPFMFASENLLRRLTIGGSQSSRISTILSKSQGRISKDYFILAENIIEELEKDTNPSLIYKTSKLRGVLDQQYASFKKWHDEVVPTLPKITYIGALVMRYAGPKTARFIPSA